MGCLRSNPIPAGPAACAAFHNSGGFVGEEGGRAAFLPGWGHQRRRAASKATQGLGVDDCNPPFSPLLATSDQQPDLFCARSTSGGQGFIELTPAVTFDHDDLGVFGGGCRLARSILGGV